MEALQSPYFPSFQHSSALTAPELWPDHIKYHAASPAKAANQVANRTCPVGCLRVAMTSWPKYAVPPDAAVTQKKQTKPNLGSKLPSSNWFQSSTFLTYPFWRHSRDTCWCLHPFLHEQTYQRLEHPPELFCRFLPAPQTPARTDIKLVLEQALIPLNFIFCYITTLGIQLYGTNRTLTFMGGLFCFFLKKRGAEYALYWNFWSSTLEKCHPGA